MGTKVVSAHADGAPEVAVRTLIDQVRAGLLQRSPALMVVFASTMQPLAEVLAPLQAAFPGTCLVGASSAGEMTEVGHRKGSVALFALAGDFEVHAGLGRGLEANVERAVSEAVATLPESVPAFSHRTAILLLDPLSGRSEEATLIASSLLGRGVRLAGGAAADDLRMASTQVGLGSESTGDAVVVAMLYSKVPLGVGVSHGHIPLSEPMRVTRAEGPMVLELDGRPAWDVWREHTREHAAASGIDVDALVEAEVGAYLLRYEAGIATCCGDYKIRAPLSRGPHGALRFACGIPTGTRIRITESDSNRQLGSARCAVKRAREQIGNGPLAGALVFDCACRSLILGTAFGDAVRGMAEEVGGAPLVGLETYGEIALDAGDLSGFHNTTTVVLAFPA
jgi:methyl-accepting chemotaxis protein